MRGKIKNRRRRGFTLVELLVVIIIIGILAAAAMLASGGGTASARAAIIISNLRTLKSAAIQYYVDNGEWPDGVERLFKYLDSDIIKNDKDEYDNRNYNLEITQSGRIFVCYRASMESQAVREKLAAQSAQIGLIGNGQYWNYPGNYTITDNNVALLVYRGNGSPDADIIVI